MRGAWQPLTNGTTIGYRRLVRIPETPLRAARVTIEDAIEEPLSVAVGLYRGS